ncbi:peptidase inhibitor family I36 protein [Streptomyces sp. F001]|uniref:peptidase inhibitor family I36 protein n=2 Tax=unclassified Streptomyces TaxID=2593676 RepID=UPI001F0EFAAD|nr:peptidase inhibitor family I36 protein [Streptomyces sp. F001]
MAVLISSLAAPDGVFHEKGGKVKSRILKSNRIRVMAVGTAVAAATALAAPSAHAGTNTPTVSRDDLARAAVSCPSGYVCFWTGSNFTGSKCQWDVADPDWQGGSIRCSWSATHNVKSVFNAGTSSATGVAYYSGANYVNRKGCTRQQHGGNLAGTYKLRSHRWISGSCG